MPETLFGLLKICGSGYRHHPEAMGEAERLFFAKCYISISMRQTDSALSYLLLNIQGHVEVPKSKFFLKKIMSVSCYHPFYVEI